MLCEAVVRFGANAFSELCPTDGPAKVAEDTKAATTDLDDVADALETGLNHYLTTVDKPWTPDTDAMLLRIGVDGSVFKKVYHDPILRRPVSRAVYGDDVIVNNAATSIYDARRITHRVMMGNSTLRRMQLLGAYLDIPVGDPGWIQKDAPATQTEQISGIRKNEGAEQEDRDHEIYECYCELDIPDFEHETAGKPDGLAVPYKVAIHKESRQVLEVRRNYNQEDEMCLPKTHFVQFPFIRGFGFYGIGLSHLLGNITNGVTAAYREFIDAGMFSNFPGLLAAKGTSRQDSSVIRIPPGGMKEIETGGLPIQQVVMGMPYKSPDATFVGFVQQLNSEAQRLGGTAEVMVGEGRQDAPVGTTLALIEQAIKPLLATHKRLCAAQSDELQLLVERFREDPGAFYRHQKQGPDGYSWDDQLLVKALNTYNIVTRADPNTASHLQRMLRNAALYQMAKDEPGAFDTKKIRQVCIRGIGFANPDQYLNPNPQPPPPDPKAQAAMIAAQAQMLDAQAKQGQLQLEARNAPLEAQGKQMDAQAKIQTAQLGLQKQQLATHTAGIQAQNEKMKPAMEQAGRQHEAQQNQADRAADVLKQQMQQAHEMKLAGVEQQGDMQKAHMEHQSAIQQAGMQQQSEMQRVSAEQQGRMAEVGAKHQTEMAKGQLQHQTAMAQGEQQKQTTLAQGAQQHQTALAQGEQQKQTTLAQGKQQHQGKLQEIKAQPKPAKPSRATGGRVMTPFGEAQQAPDGHHYVRHPISGQYFRVKKGD